MPRTKSALAAMILPGLCLTLAAAQSQPKTGDPVTLHSTAKLVVVDVVVTDKQGHAVHNLKQSDFTLFENKSAQTITSFTEHVAERAGAVAPLPKLPPGIYANYTSTIATEPVNILLLDTLNTPMQDQSIVRQQLLDYLNRAKPGSRVAIFGLTTRLLMLQDFTADPEVLKWAIGRESGKGSPLLADSVSGDDHQLQLSDELEASNHSTAEAIANAAAFEAEQQLVEVQSRTKITLDAMNVLARYLAGIPGRKNLIWFSGSFPITVVPQMAHNGGLLSRTGNPFQGSPSAQQEFFETINLLSRSQVAVYPIQAHGLEASSVFDPSKGGVNTGGKYARNNPAAAENDETASFVQTAADDHTMLQLADDTGGAAFVLGNGLADAVGKAIDNGSSYYTLSYTPASDRRGYYRSLEVSVAGKGYKLAYRRGYYALDPDAPHADITGKAVAGSLQIAMGYGTPPSTQILMRARAIPAGKADDPSPAPGDKPNVDPKKSNAVYRRYEVDYAADPAGIAFETFPDGRRRGTLAFVTCVYSLSGELVNTKYQNVTVNLTAAQYTSALTDGLNYRQEIGVPVGGRYLLRLGVHDLRSDRIGTVNVPASTDGAVSVQGSGK